MTPSNSSPRIPSAARSLPALAAVAVIGTVVIAGVAGGFGGNGGGGDADSTSTVAATSTTSTTTPVTVPIAVESTEAPVTDLSMPLGRGMAGTEVRMVQERLAELGFFVGEIDGQFGPLLEQALWAYQKLVMNVPSDEPTSILTNDIWHDMQRGIKIEPLRSHAEGEATENHVEIYLPSQVAVFFVDDEPAMIVHVSSGDGQEWKEEVTIDVGEYGNEHGTEPLVRGEIGVSMTPGGVFRIDRMVEGLRNSALGGMWDPAYFNYGIALHGAINVPLYPASHGCIRMSQTAGRTFHQFIEKGDQVFVWDGIKEPEYYAANANLAYPRGQTPVFNRIDPDYSTTTTSTVAPTTTVAQTTPTTRPQATPAPTQATSPPPAPTLPAATTTVPAAPTEPATTTTVAGL